MSNDTPTSKGMCWCGEPVHTEETERMKAQAELAQEIVDFVMDFEGLVPGDHLLRIAERLGLPRNDEAWNIVRKRLTDEPSGERLEHLQRTLQWVSTHEGVSSHVKDIVLLALYGSAEPPSGDLADAIENNNLKDITIADLRSLLREAREMIEKCGMVSAGLQDSLVARIDAVLPETKRE